ncbi:MAG: tetratricopeptide repeat protein [Rhodocyclales bacterium]|nr:tetratricopeptide repeat protein [Rhodocyclales bacterium]
MSLLLDALKKAEAAKRQSAAAGADSPAAPQALALDPAPPPPASPLPDLSAHIDAVDADLAAVSTTLPLRKPASQRREPFRPPTDGIEAEREAARNVFAAKQTPMPQRTPLWVALAAVGIAGLGIGGWFWWQLQSIGAGSLAARPAPETPASPSPLASAPLASPQPPTPPIAEPAPTTARPFAEAAREAEPQPRTPPSSAAAAEPESPVRITRGQLRVNPALAQAYERLQAGDAEGAADAYAQVLRGDPRNVDALLGMASVALRRGQPSAAEAWYLKALEADPKDINAQAGLIDLRGQADPITAESRLKGLLANKPDSATLNFSLGNLYAGQRRWAEAQQAYFNAHIADGTHPDYLFNLAASLDHLHLPQLALDYYQSALTAAGDRQPSFDAAQVRARIKELQH